MFKHEWCFWVVLVAIITICFTISYFIAVSDLPDWVKFILLK